MQFAAPFTLVAPSTFIALAIIMHLGFVSAIPFDTMSLFFRESEAAPYAINVGTSGSDTIAWVGGQSKCNHVVITADGTNFCGIRFDLNEDRDFTVEGCGSDQMWINKPGHVGRYANCGSLNEKEDCKVVSRYHCI